MCECDWGDNVVTRQSVVHSGKTGHNRCTTQLELIETMLCRSCDFWGQVEIMDCV